ncbi:MAG: alpha/beta fold hydrolase [Deltaproteobacteria bacterium]|nr:alpha/beta fold hydrolase [Deltaproteobacteria bacterium]
MMRSVTNVISRLFKGPAPVGSTPADVVFRENKWRLLRYRARAEGPAFATPVLLVPSLINRHYVLDLLPGRSFVEDLVRRGHEVFLLDWGAPGDEDRFLDFDTITDRYLGRAIRATCRAAEVEQLHLLGYCLGGTLTAIHAAVHPERVASLTALAAPIGFHDSGLLSLWTRTKSFDVAALIAAFGNVPWPLMQASFELLKPTLNWTKGVQLLDRAWDDQFLDAFWAIETWGHDNVSFPGECYRRYIEELYRGDALLAGTFSLSGQPVRLERITCPTLVVSFEHDHIVPAASAAVLLDRVGAQERERIHLDGGHVGAVVSQKAARTLWPALSQWWARHDRPAPASRRRFGARARGASEVLG